jgi:chemotaxis protein MotB
MSDGAPAKKADGGGGAPAWVMTFADLMSLLMCFFVLLLSFSEMDLQKFKQIAGSMKNAFGVQRDIKSNEPPKGTSIISQEFSPGRPTPTLVNEVRQNTIDETKQTLEFTDAMTEQEKKESIDAGEDNDGSGTEAMQRQPIKQNTIEMPDTSDVAMLSDKDAEKQDNEEEPKESSAADSDSTNPAENTAAQEKTEAEQKTITDTYKLLKTLEPEIEQGLIAIKTQGNRILLRINEKGSFPSGSSILQGTFIPVLNKLRKSLNDIEGKIVVAGHTDDIPIKTARFRSNWELSASRAVTVVHELLEMDTIKPERFVVEGHGDAHPLVANDNANNRALNRRVELIIVQNEGEDGVNNISADSTQNPFTKNFSETKTPELTSSVQEILDKETTVPDQKEIDAINLQTLKDRFELIRKGLIEQ